MTEQPEARTVLVLTVGGSPEPLRTALREAAASEVWFIASEARGDQKSSRGEAETLSAEFGASGGRSEIREVPADDPDKAFSRIGVWLDELARQQPPPRIVANYTGGTKSMSAALILAAIRRDVAVQITTGPRKDLVKVRDGDETVRSIETRVINLERDLATALRLAASGDYAAAAELVDALKHQVAHQRTRLPRSVSVKLERCRDWAACLAAWDRFDHKVAWRGLETAYDAGFAWAEDLERSGHRAVLADLAAGKNEPRISLCQDLLANARRRRDQRRFDDALGRLYRFTEACVQTQLFTRWKLKSGAVPAADLPAAMRETTRPGPGGIYKLGLMDTVRLLRHRDSLDPLAAAFGENEWGPDWLNARNKSILAHGYRAIDEKVVQEAFGWIEGKVVPAIGMTPMPPFPKEPALH